LKAFNETRDLEVKEVTALVEAARGDDLEAFRRLVVRFQDMAYGYAFSLLGDFHRAQDAAQEAFVEAYRDLPDLREAAAFAGWFRRIVFKQCNRITRKKKVPEVPLDESLEIPSEMTDLAAAIDQEEMMDKVLEAIQALPDHERTVTSLYYINGYSQKEIAEFLEVPAKTVKSRLYSSRKRLKERMSEIVGSTMKSVPLPDGFPETVVRIVATQRDLEGAEKLLATSYHHKREPKMFASIASAREAGIYIVSDNNAVRAAGWYNEVDWSIGSTVMRAVRPREMCCEAQGVPHPDFVRGFEGCFTMASERGCPLAVAHGSQFDHAFCRFVPCFYHPVANLASTVAKAIVTAARVREVQDERERREAWQAFLRDPYAAKIGGMSPKPMTHVIEVAGVPQGYLSLQKDWYGKTVFPSMTVKTREGALAALKFMAETTDSEEVNVQESHMTWITRALLALGGRYLLRPACNVVGLDNELVAIIDLVTLTETLAAEFQRRATGLAETTAKAGFSLEMDGQVVAFVMTKGTLEIGVEAQKIHQVLPMWLTTRLYMGYYSGQEILEMGAIP
jgi:RNA polymerase sigma factor (sigma-70 family)